MDHGEIYQRLSGNDDNDKAATVGPAYSAKLSIALCQQLMTLATSVPPQSQQGAA